MVKRMQLIEVTEENVDLLTLWLDENIDAKNVFVESALNKKTICNYSFLRESIFAGRIWCCVTVEDTEIKDILMINIPDSYREKVKSGEVLVYYAEKEDFIENAVRLVATVWKDQIRKLQFIIKSNQIDSDKKIKGTIREVCIEINKEYFCIDSIFIDEEYRE